QRRSRNRGRVEIESARTKRHASRDRETGSRGMKLFSLFSSKNRRLTPSTRRDALPRGLKDFAAQGTPTNKGFRGGDPAGAALVPVRTPGRMSPYILEPLLPRAVEAGASRTDGCVRARRDAFGAARARAGSATRAARRAPVFQPGRARAEARPHLRPARKR